jgi:hypothetical protein
MIDFTKNLWDINILTFMLSDRTYILPAKAVLEYSQKCLRPTFEKFREETLPNIDGEFNMEFVRMIRI